MGLQLASFLNSMNEKLATNPNGRRGFKPNVGFTADPVPAATVGTLPHLPSNNVGHHVRDPIPAVCAEDYQGEAFKPGVSFSVDPIPARSM